MAGEVALITGITGQDGSYLTELLLGKNYVVHGIVQPTADLSGSAIEHLAEDEKIGRDRLFLHRVDLFDAAA